MRRISAIARADDVDRGTRAVTWARIRSHATASSDEYALIAGDARKVMNDLPDGSIDSCLTSPPYWQARDYGHSSQIGLEPTVDEFVSNLASVFREVRRVLADDGVAWLNIGDAYLHGVGTVDGKPPSSGWRRNKQLALVPFKVAIALQQDGWWLRNVVVWHKPNAMPSSVKDRLTTSWEPIFLLAKSENYHFNLDAIRVPHETDDSVERARAIRGGANGKAHGKPHLRRWLNSPRHRSTIEGLREIERRPAAPKAPELAAYLRAALEAKGQSIEWVANHLGLPFERTRHYFRTDEIGARLPPPDVWDQLKRLLDLNGTYDKAMAVAIGDNVFRNHPLGRNPGDVWSISLRGSGDSHFATMPLSLAERCLRATLPHGGICLDPFMGTGTTGAAALSIGGRFVGIDIHESYFNYFLDDIEQLALLPRDAGT